VTEHPTALWITQTAPDFTGDLADQDGRFNFLIRDRDTKFTASFDEIFRAENMRVIPTPVRAPRANAYAERWVRTVRVECLDHLLILGRRHAERVLRVYVSHYNAQRPHRGLDLALPERPDLECVTTTLLPASGAGTSWAASCTNTIAPRHSYHQPTCGCLAAPWLLAAEGARRDERPQHGLLCDRRSAGTARSKVLASRDCGAFSC
jgi:hypothetical protein